MRGVEQIPWLYDALCAIADRLWLAAWRRWLVEGAAGRTLEVGCGTGRNLPLYRRDVRVIAIEPAWASLVRARRRAPGVRFVRARAEALPFRDASFDTIVSGLVFCSVDDPWRGLREVRRTLRASGALRMLEHVRSSSPWKARLQDRVQPLWTRLMGGCRPNRDTERTVADAGFAIDPGTRTARGEMRRFAARPLDA